MAKLWNRVGRWVEHARGAAVIRDLSPYRGRLESVREAISRLARFDELELRGRAVELRRRSRGGEPSSELEAELFAVVCEAADRTLGLAPFDVQILAGLAMQDGHVVEMGTGEGKTLAAVLPACLGALGGRGVHLLTFNDYLARRDAAWMGPVYEWLGLEVASIDEESTPEARRRAYAADVTYLTAKEAGFDLLRDGLCREPSALVQRELHMALVDEADSLLIDDARNPLVIAESRGKTVADVAGMARAAGELREGRHWTTDEYRRNVDLTGEGLDRARELLGCGELVAPDHFAELTMLNCALHAEVLLRRDVDYIVRDGEVKQVDELTGRVVEDRQWPDGLQAALQAKEGLPQRSEGRVVGSISLQHFLRLYPKLCGMTGTAATGAEELREFYGLEVVVIPPNRPSVREDHPDLLFTHRSAKNAALIGEIRRAHAVGRPLLVGTASVDESEELAASLRRVDVSCRVLNARNDEEEARIVAQAGALGAVTISTNMAGRGTDIRLGGEDERERDEVVASGGLYVLGTNRHESERIDRQLRGRAGRQGDPGTTRLFISLEDPLPVRYGLESLIPDKHWPEPQQAPLDHPVIRREFARAQRIVEGQNFEIRKTLLRYSEPIEKQRREVRSWRDGILRREEDPAGFKRHEPGKRAAAVRQVGEESVRFTETRITLDRIDRHWSRHLAMASDLREGIHLLRVGGQDPATVFLHRVVEAYLGMRETVERDVASRLASTPVSSAGLDLDRRTLDGPTSTWTYLVNDDPFRDQLGIQLMGSTGFAAAAALYTGPILILWGLYDRFVRKRRRD